MGQKFWKGRGRVPAMAGTLLAILAVAGSAGATDLTAGGLLKLQDRSGTDEDRMKVKIARDPALAGTLANPIDVPTCLAVRQGPVSLQTSRLPGSLWKESSPGASYAFADALSSSGVQKLKLRSSLADGSVTARLSGAPLGEAGFSGPADDLQVSLGLGNRSYCAQFASPPSTVKRNEPGAVQFTGPSAGCVPDLPLCCDASPLVTCAGKIDAILTGTPAQMTATLQDKLDQASTSSPVPGLIGPDCSTPQGRVYLPAGTYRLNRIDMPSNVRFEIAPGATLINAEVLPSGSGNPVWTERAIFNFGREINGVSTSVSNISIVAGDGCGGPGVATTANKPPGGSTAFRGNDPVVPNNSTLGMENINIYDDPRWPVDGMFVIDLDAREHGTSQENLGFLFQNAKDVLVENVFSIQNPERKLNLADADSTVRMSRSAVMDFLPPRTAVYSSNRESIQAPHRIHVRWHYNVLSPSGYGPNQVWSCLDCDFENIFSHGGVALRLETDVPQPTSGADNCASGSSAEDAFDYYGFDDGIRARNIEGKQGNAVVYLTPHCRDNGRVDIRRVKGTGMRYVAVVSNGELAQANLGSFTSDSVLADLQGTPGLNAQDPKPANNTYRLTDSKGAIARNADYDVNVDGDLCWPAGSPPLWDGTPLPGNWIQASPPCASLP